MAILNSAGCDRIYDMHRRWLNDVLPSGDSLLTPGSTVWTAEHLDELEYMFVGRPDLTKDKRFLEKLHDQLAPVSPHGVQLMAELHVVHFLILWNGAISAAKKISDLDTILSWMPYPVALPDDVRAAMSPGLVHPGQWVMTRRDTQLTWLIRFSRAWIGEPADRRLSMINDPWALRAFAESVHAPSSENARLSLLHLAHPATFEAIVSHSHKDQVAARFKQSPGAIDDVDRELLKARAALEPVYGEGFTWYDDPILYCWSKSTSGWKSFLKWAARFRAEPNFEVDERAYKLDLASYLETASRLLVADDDGWTNALRSAFVDKSNNLTQWQAHSQFLSYVESDPDAVRSSLRQLWSGGGDALDRLDLFLGAVPTAALGPLGARVNIGSFLLMAEDATIFPPMKIRAFRDAWKLANWGREPNELTPGEVYRRGLVFLDELVRDSSDWAVPLRDRLDAQGAMWALVRSQQKPASWTPGEWAEFVAWRELEPSEEDDDSIDPDATTTETGEVVPRVDYIADAANDLHIDRVVLDEIVELLDDKRQVVLYGPPGTGKTFLAVRLAKAIAKNDASRVSIVQFHPATSYEDFFEGLRPSVTDAGQVTYERTDGPLVAIASAAAADPDHTYVLVIDEINRANLPKVFGELLFLLEYRNESARTLYRPTEPFRLPTNLWMIGTMNTSDRSVAVIDAAMRRRFHFVPFFPHDGPMKGLLGRWLKSVGGRVGVASLLDAANEELMALVGEHLLIGPSHFMKTDLSDKALERVWTYNIFPLIEEQLWGDREAIDQWRWAAVRQRFDWALNGTGAGVGPEVADGSADLGGNDEGADDLS